MANDPDLKSDIKMCDVDNYLYEKAEIWIGSPPYEKILYINKGQLVPLQMPLIKPIKTDVRLTEITCRVGNRWSTEKFEITSEMFKIGEELFNIPKNISTNNPNIKAVGIDLGMTRCSVAVNRNVEKDPKEVTTILLKHIKQKVEEFQGKTLDEVVITVPANFTNNQKIATHIAAELAGWKTVHLLEEPIAASIAYFIDRPIPSNFNILIFDLGGGTLDLCIFKVENNKLKIIAVDGDCDLGGRNFDDLLFHYFAKILKDDFTITINERNTYRLLQKCVEIKHTLSVEGEAR
uniref:Hypoxia up-regulated protein 1 n=1 Tax=Panagrolaimus davidi TaxID=227884 RepID=A0A914PJR7_9BILA